MKRVLNLLFCFMLIAMSCEKGDPGLVGATGEPGIPGRDGSVIHSGSGAPEESLGNDGDMYLDLASAQLYGPKTTTGWGTPLSLQGDKGNKGDKGNTGATGAQGPRGATGPRGEKGDKGDKGNTGAT